jgi:hypothetical protein
MADDLSHCGICRMYDTAAGGVCWGYGNITVDPLYVCDSFEPSAMLRQLDGFAPMSGGVSGEGGLQMVPEVAAKPKSKKRKRSAPAADDPPEHVQGEPDDEDPAKQFKPDPERHARTLDADPAAEPTAKWFERLLSQDKLREAFDGCRDHIQAAVGPQALQTARLMAHVTRENGDLARFDAPPDLADALTAHYEDMYQLGRATVADELARQRRALGMQLDDPGDLAAGGAAGERLKRARQRGEHSARNIVNKVREGLGRAQITGLLKPSDLQTAAEQAAASALRMEALANTAAMVNDGRYDQAASDSQVVGAFYTSVMDDRSCDPCITADNGVLLSPQEAVALGPPNPYCAGQDRCRCALVWVLSPDPAALQAALGD